MLYDSIDERSRIVVFERSVIFDEPMMPSVFPLSSKTHRFSLQTLSEHRPARNENVYLLGSEHNRFAYRS
jgi:hypothetical protein